ncbi:dTDP-4-dehydrorhamnose reductase [Micromonospora pallida]|uniref:dTDP-4-dehydrorhamnose reductase n=1 Tax=Micromonospora pallida TaxID=145854 RepID=A0A1C6SMB2_9ACTN|nr:sugar nucleotide-binding protein [Micromonospora pallida]SCL30664.1 dTDP-4-dehydrorhamnose reductase [Micromonospora pallida]
MTLLVVGASGHLGGELCRRAVAAGERVIGTYHTREPTLAGVESRRLDVRDRAAVRALVTAVRPDAVVGTSYRFDDWAVTADGAAHVALAAAEAGARLVHVSSDAVHGGRAEPYADDEPPSPTFPYGAAKAAAEVTVRSVHPAAALVRTSLILGDRHSKQVRLCLDALAGRATLFTDEVRCPVHVGDLADAVLTLVATDHAGPLNVAGADALSRAELGLLVARRYGLDPIGMKTTTSGNTGRGRPLTVLLDSSRAARLLPVRLRGAHEFLAR